MSESSHMRIDPELLTTEEEAGNVLGNLRNYRDLLDFCKTRKHVPFLETIRYIVFLYSQDSPLNKKPLLPLPERQIKAALKAGYLKKENNDFHDQVKTIVFDLAGEYVFRFVFEYLTTQPGKSYLWSEICTLGHQIAEAQKLRMPYTEAESSKELILSLDEKAKVTKHTKEWMKALQEYEEEFFEGHEEVKEAFNLESSGLARIELYAIER